MNDLISRQDAINAICAGSLSAATVYGRTDKGMAALKETVKLIKELPSVSTEKAGRWILTDKEEEIYCHVAICSVCGKESVNEGVDDYCSWCGAKMG